MTKYSKDILLESEPYKTVRFTVSDCESPEHADNELKIWLKKYPELVKLDINKKIIAMVLIK